MTPILPFPSCEKSDLSARICKRYSKEVSALASRCFEITMTTAHDVFFEFSAHVQQVSVKAHLGGYKSTSDNQVGFETYIAAGSGRDKQITK